jgi:hypothetical protein
MNQSVTVSSCAEKSFVKYIPPKSALGADFEVFHLENAGPDGSARGKDRPPDR